MKKSLLSLIIVTFIISISISAFAYNIGDIIGQTLTTDIVAQINGYDIASYNYNGYTYIVAEDLKNYGFSVTYDNSSRSLGIKRNLEVTNIYSSYVKPPVTVTDLGKVAFNILYTDIKTYVDDQYVNSYNINGQTIIRFDTLACFGSCVWDNNTRKITLDIPGISKANLTNNGISENTIHEILESKKSFIDYDSGKEVTIETLSKINTRYMGSPGMYTVIDLDSDGNEEVLIEYNLNGDTAVINCKEGILTAYYISYRGRLNLKTDGTMTYSNGAADLGVHKLFFDNEGIKSIDLIVYNANSSIVNGKQVTKEACEFALSEQDKKANAEWLPII